MSNQKISPWEYTYNVTNVKQHKPSKENLIVEFYSNDTLLCINFQTVGTADKHDRSSDWCGHTPPSAAGSLLEAF